MSLLTASFQKIIIISFLIIIHELGHCLAAIIEKVSIERIILYPLGGITKLKMPLNISPKKEMFILCLGPIFQCFACLLLEFLFPYKIIDIRIYHYSILFFNLLPIYPLDGGKLLKILLELYLPYQNSFQCSVIISYILEILLFIKSPTKKINTFITILLLLVLTRKEHRKKKIIYEKFLLERYLKKYHFYKTKIINNKNHFYRNKKHIIKENGKYYLENDFLAKKYHKIDKNY